MVLIHLSAIQALEQSKLGVLRALRGYISGQQPISATHSATSLA